MDIGGTRPETARSMTTRDNAARMLASALLLAAAMALVVTGLAQAG